MRSKIRSSDTIAAIATPPGEGAIAIVRISGGSAIPLTERIFRGRSDLSGAPGYSVHHGYVHDGEGTTLDEVLVTVFRHPHSYTGEDSVEISCHGGSISSSRILNAVLQNGGRQADPGEFTKRAYLNGRLDLTQAEAVADLISARSQRAQEISLAQLNGALKTRTTQIASDLLSLCSLLEIDLDFSEEGISVVSIAEIDKRLNNAQRAISALLETLETGKILREGIRVVLAGLPNAGKSSVFNALLSHDRSIVSEHPGTTRDYIEESISISGVLFSILDTAGLRGAMDPAEQEGISRSRNLVRSSDITVMVVDLSSPPDREVIQRWFSDVDPGKMLVAFNKSDLVQTLVTPEAFQGRKFQKVFISAVTGFGLNNLRDALFQMTGISDSPLESGPVAINRRHADSLTRAASSLDEAIRSVQKGMTNEFVAVDVRAALGSISEITGETTTEDVINGIFERFCVGK